MNSCPFCHPEVAPLLSNELAFACLEKYLVNEGHLLLVPRRHVASWFDAAFEERASLLTLIDQGRRWLESRDSPNGYNIGINIGAAAGQTIMHLHVHLIPRYHGDSSDPRGGGVRGVIPGKQWYPSPGGST